MKTNNKWRSSSKVDDEGKVRLDSLQVMLCTYEFIKRIRAKDNFEAETKNSDSEIRRRKRS